MSYILPTTTDFKAYFTRDFPFGIDVNTNVLDSDIQKSIDLANFDFNEGLFLSQANYNIGFMLLAAHYLVMSLRSSSQGLSGQYEWLVSSKGVGSVSEGLSIPQRILENPVYSMLSKTNYGAEFLMLVLPQLNGQIFTVCGDTTP